MGADVVRVGHHRLEHQMIGDRDEVVEREHRRELAEQGDRIADGEPVAAGDLHPSCAYLVAHHRVASRGTRRRRRRDMDG